MADIDVQPKAFTPSIRVTPPNEWFVKESVTVLAPTGQANVIASSEPLDPQITTEQYAGIQGQLLDEEFPDYLELSYGPAKVFGGLDGYVRRFEWTPPDGVPVVQIQLYAVRDERGLTATATTPRSVYQDYEAELLAILTSLDVT